MSKFLVTGATGFIAAHTIERLLQAGHEVVGTVRDLNNSTKLAHLNALDVHSGKFSLVEADLLDDDPFSDLMNVDVVLHMASPYIVSVENPQSDLVDPAVNGTLSILRAAAQSDTVKRVVVTSSMAAITDEPDGRVLTEEDWNDKSSLKRNPYYFSKAEAESAAWEFIDQHNPKFDLVAINPFLVVGPALSSSINASNQILIDILNGTYPAILDLDFGFVDVRDVADAHIKAATIEDASGRYIVASGNMTMDELVRLMKNEGYTHLKLPSMKFAGPIGTALMKVASYSQPAGVGSYLRTHLGRHPRFDTSKLSRDLGISLRSPVESVKDTLADLSHWGHISAPTDELRKKGKGMGVWLRRGAIGIALAFLLFLGAFKLMHGMGKPYPDISTDPVLEMSAITTPIMLPFPPGMVAASSDGRIFYTYHMLHKPERFVDATVFEWVDGEGVPFPSQEMQSEFHGAMGVVADNHDRLWVIKPGALEGERTRLVAINRTSGEMVLDHLFAKGEAGFAQDMRISPDGRTVYLADTGLFKFTKPGLIVFDVETKSARTVLSGHPSVSPQNWVKRKTDGKDYRLAFGLLTFVVGVDGISLTADGDWLYYATMSHDSVYKVPTSVLLNEEASDEEIAASIEFVGKKPMSDGTELLEDNSLIITDVENGGLARLYPNGSLVTLTKDPRVDWADSVTVAPDGSIWFTDSRLTDLINQFAQPANEQTMRERGPYPIYRVSLGD